ncbi:fructosamine kinase family protein [Acidiferrobacter sp.]|uniref:fructosamine kinase family protein n=1 Tax=Acidiferrobacter sp. TaxID=1872107 RepID=UPI00261CC71A|nr:fructosamine kinase family protein [Acidiferrobacter sp.]
MVSWGEIAQQISQATGKPFVARVARTAQVSGLNDTTILSDGARSYFVKHNDPGLLEMFRAEALGLMQIANTHTVPIGQPVCSGATDEISYLVLPYLDLSHRAPSHDRKLGHALAALHACHFSSFGWHRDNTIGTTAQINTPHADWAVFFRDRRIVFQLDLACKNGYGDPLQEPGHRLAEAIPALLEGHKPMPSLLHGDLWSGNCLAYDDRPILFDPAVYYGDRETDLAMTELFGGFSPAFYAAYKEAAPLESGYSMRKTLYNLYHVLNHLNLAGRGYLGQAQRMMAQLLAEIGH